MRDVADVERVWYQSEMVVQEDLNAGYGKLLCKMFRFMIWE
jgi:hypothetical protein